MDSRTLYFLGALAGAGALWAFARTQRGQSAAADAVASAVGGAAALEGSASDFLEEVTVTAKRIGATVASWVLPASGEKYRPFFVAAAAKYNVPAGLLEAQAYQESRFRADIINGTTQSSAGAVGIMQIIPKWHPELSPGDAAADRAAALDPARAIDYAAKYLRSLFNRYGTWQLALAAYNAGPGNVDKYKGIPPFKETQQYVAQISERAGLLA